jgi:serpin B
MKRRLLPLALAFACADPSGPGAAPPRITALPRQLSATETEMVAASNTFGFDLLRAVNASFADTNVFLSPVSASMALGMTMNGAEGTTFEEMRGALGFGPRSYEELNQSYQSLIALLRGLDPRVEFRIANAIFYRTSFGPFIEAAFLNDARQYFDAEVGALDFGAPSAVGVVNAWADRNTNGRIPRIIDRIEAQIVMLLMNAIYFKGDWRAGFATSETRNQPFTTGRGTVVQVPTMHRKGGYRVAGTPDATVIELPYGGDAFVMTILLPRVDLDFNAFVEGLTSDAWQQATTGLADTDREIYLPKFRLSWEHKLNDDLKSLGMRQAFVPGGAEFTRLSRSQGRDLYIDFVKQKTFVDVNEVGTEAAAVTVVGIGVVCACPPPVVRIDRPFVFAIRERLSGTVLFLGKITDPRP